MPKGRKVGETVTAATSGKVKGVVIKATDSDRNPPKRKHIDSK
jgi:hypothetical protein